MKKFYKLVSTRAADGGWLIELDGKPVRTPAGAKLSAPSPTLADHIAREWSAQENDILPETMPLTQMLVTVIDRIASQRPAMETAILAYLDTDLLCYRAAEPPELVEKETAARDPWLRWFEREHGITLETTTGLTALKQPRKAHETVTATVSAMDIWHFNVAQMITGATGSLVLALAFVTGAASENDILQALYVEENYKSRIYNEEFYGRAPHQEKAMQGVARDVKAGRVFLESL